MCIYTDACTYIYTYIYTYICMYIRMYLQRLDLCLGVLSSVFEQLPQVRLPSLRPSTRYCLHTACIEPSYSLHRAFVEPS